MNFGRMSDEEKLEKMREHLKKSAESFGFPVPAEWVSWLLARYQALPGALQPVPEKEITLRRFSDLEAEEMITLLHREAERATNSTLTNPTVPAPWVTWLLAEYDRLSA